jgi:hypothetical protein
MLGGNPRSTQRERMRSRSRTIIARRSTEPAIQRLYRDYVVAIVDDASSRPHQRTPEEIPADYQRQAALLSSVKATAVFQLTFTDLDVSAIPQPPRSIVPIFAALGMVDTQLRPKQEETQILQSSVPSVATVHQRSRNPRASQDDPAKRSNVRDVRQRISIH